MPDEQLVRRDIDARELVVGRPLIVVDEPTETRDVDRRLQLQIGAGRHGQRHRGDRVVAADIAL